jgi:glucosyl-dolichyl phosphate glucuronosyltransferase
VISVIVCTYNRCRLLAKALESIAASVVPDSVEWEILVVDNSSTDKTPDVVMNLAKTHPQRVRYLSEAQQGKSFALNRAIRESRGEVLAFTDDDVTVEPTWLWNLTAALHGSEWAGAGGHIVPIWGRPLPRWLSPRGLLLSGPFVALDLGPEPVSLLQAPVGANMAFRKEVFTKYGPFRTDLGPRPGTGIRGEDSEFGDRLLSAGEHLRYEPTAIVYHPVPAERLEKKYLLAWFFGHGYEEVMMSRIPSRAKLSIGGIPVHLFRRLGRWFVQWLLTINPAKRFECRLYVWGVAGAIRASYQLSRHAQVKTDALPISSAVQSVNVKARQSVAD